MKRFGVLHGVFNEFQVVCSGLSKKPFSHESHRAETEVLMFLVFNVVCVYVAVFFQPSQVFCPVLPSQMEIVSEGSELTDRIIDSLGHAVCRS